MTKPFMPTPVVSHLTDKEEIHQRAAIIAEAKTWVGTPYRQLGNSKGASVDCSMLLVECLISAGIFQKFDPRPYPPNWHLHKKEEKYLDWMNTLSVETGETKPGNIVVFRFGQCFSHGGILITPTRIVHAYVHWGFCAESEMTEVELFNRHAHGRPIHREKKFFDVWAKIKKDAK
jgi:cell wall-associated NlpC family hydrolase